MTSHHVQSAENERGIQHMYGWAQTAFPVRGVYLSGSKANLVGLSPCPVKFPQKAIITRVHLSLILGQNQIVLGHFRRIKVCCATLGSNTISSKQISFISDLPNGIATCWIVCSHLFRAKGDHSQVKTRPCNQQLAPRPPYK